MGHLMHNPGVRRWLAVCLLALFAVLVAADAFACPDGCQSADSQPTADRCNATGVCVFCTGGVAAVATPIAIAPLFTTLPVSSPLAPAFPVLSGAVLDHPPRRS